MVTKNPANNINEFHQTPIGDKFNDVPNTNILETKSRGKPKYNLRNKLFDISIDYTISNYTTNNIVDYFETNNLWIKRLLKVYLQKYGKFKLQLNPKLIFYNSLTETDQVIYRILKPVNIITLNSFDDYKDDFIDQLSSLIEEMEMKGSGFIFDSIEELTLSISKIANITGSSFLESPLGKNCNSIINVQNKNDNFCFLYTILSYFYNDLDHKYRPSIYKKYMIFNETNQPIGAILPNNKRLNLEGINYPVSIKDIKRVEDMNDYVSINIFSIKTGTVNLIEPIRISKFHNREHVIDMLYISKEENFHYCLITKLANLINKCSKKKIDHSTLVCRNCLYLTKDKKSLDNHINICFKNKPQRLIMPKNNILKFKNHYMKSRIPFYIVADFESSNHLISTCKPSDNLSYETKIAKQVPNSYGLYIHSDHENIVKSEYIYYITEENSGEETIDKFIDTIISLNEKFTKIFYKYSNIPTPLKITSSQHEQYNNSNNCMYCNKTFTKGNNSMSQDGMFLDKVLDHDHYSGEYRGASCNKCNLEEGKQSKFLPIYFHNLSNYDARLFIKKLSKKQNEFVKLSLLPKDHETFISFQFGKIRFLDSLRFFQASLDSVAESLTDEDFIQTKIFFPNEEHFKLIRKKGVYPYEYITSIEKFNETELPPIEAFYSTLKQENIKEKQYNHAKLVWNTFECKTLRDYHLLYLKTDILLLHDCFENFRKVIYKNYEIDACHSYSTPGLTWQCGLKFTQVELELLTNEDMILMFEQGIRGGYSGVLGSRQVKSNNKYLPDYDKEKESNYILYLDANNLYGWSMSQPLPTKNFKWENEEYYKTGKPCLVECDLEYTTEAVVRTKNFPLAPYKRIIKNEELTDYQLTLMKKFNEKENKNEKLILDLHDKTKYVLHYKILKYYEQLGLRITKIHRTISFDEEPWLKKYIDNNTSNRAKAKTNFEKDIWKLLNNSFYGKTVENIRGRCNIEIVNDEKRAVRLFSKPNYHSRIIYDENLVSIQLKAKSVYFNKPIYTGMAVLDLSKLLMYKFYYETIQNNWNKAEILYHCTDSFLLNIKTDDVYEDMKKIKDELDTSDYPKDHFLFSNDNKKIIGKFKDEENGKIIEEVICLKAKAYAIKVNQETFVHKKLKGISKSTVKNKIFFEDYKNCLKDSIQYRHKMFNLKHYNQEIYTVEMSKKSLSSFDNKRHILNDGIKTNPHASDCTHAFFDFIEAQSKNMSFDELQIIEYA